MRQEQQENLPTKERKAQAERRGEGLALVLHNNSDIYHAEIIDPLRIDKLLTAKIITKAEHKNAKRLFILHVLVDRQFFPQVRYDDPELRGMDVRLRNTAEEQNFIRMSAQDVFYSVMTYLHFKMSDDLIRMVCLEGRGCIAAVKKLGFKKHRATRMLREAFRHLSEAFETVKEKQEELQKHLQEPD